MLLEQEGLRWHTFRTRHCITFHNVLRTVSRDIDDRNFVLLIIGVFAAWFSAVLYAIRAGIKHCQKTNLEQADI